jgi:hypothetical protein
MMKWDVATDVLACSQRLAEGECLPRLAASCDGHALPLSTSLPPTGIHDNAFMQEKDLATVLLPGIL